MGNNASRLDCCFVPGRRPTPHPLQEKSLYNKDCGSFIEILAGVVATYTLQRHRRQEMVMIRDERKRTGVLT